MKELILGYLAKFLAKPVVANAIIRFAKQYPYSNIGDYMERYWILPENGWLSRLLGISIRLHVIKLPDQDRAMHTHPFNFRSFILKGEYMETRPPSQSDHNYDIYHHWEGTTYHLDRTTPHAIVSLMGNESVTTLFVYDNRVGDWYFDTDEGLIPHAKYLNEGMA